MPRDDVTADHIRRLPRAAGNGWGPDLDLQNADWPKTQTWDLPTDLATLLQVLTGAGSNPTVAQMRTAVAEFLLLPAARKMPVSVLAGLERVGMVSPEEAATARARLL